MQVDPTPTLGPTSLTLVTPSAAAAASTATTPASAAAAAAATTPASAAAAAAATTPASAAAAADGIVVVSAPVAKAVMTAAGIGGRVVEVSKIDRSTFGTFSTTAEADDPAINAIFTEELRAKSAKEAEQLIGQHKSKTNKLRTAKPEPIDKKHPPTAPTTATTTNTTTNTNTTSPPLPPPPPTAGGAKSRKAAARKDKRRKHAATPTIIAPTPTTQPFTREPVEPRGDMPQIPLSATRQHQERSKLAAALGVSPDDERGHKRGTASKSGDPEVDRERRRAELKEQLGKKKAFLNKFGSRGTRVLNQLDASLDDLSDAAQSEMRGERMGSSKQADMMEKTKGVFGNVFRGLGPQERRVLAKKTDEVVPMATNLMKRMLSGPGKKKGKKSQRDPEDSDDPSTDDDDDDDHSKTNKEKEEGEDEEEEDDDGLDPQLRDIVDSVHEPHGKRKAKPSHRQVAKEAAKEAAATAAADMPVRPSGRKQTTSTTTPSMQPKPAVMPNGQTIVAALTPSQKKNRKKRDRIKQLKNTLKTSTQPTPATAPAPVPAPATPAPAPTPVSAPAPS